MQCNATYRALDRAGIDYQVIDMSADLEALEYVKRLGYTQAPVVVVEHPVAGATEQTYRTSWSGFNPGRINELKENR